MKFALLALLPAVALATPTPAPAPVPAPAALVVPQLGALIPGRYIVKMKPNIVQSLIDAALAVLKTIPLHTYNFDNFIGFAADMSPQTLQLMRLVPGVRHFFLDRYL
jgi:hypothetical protein